MMGVDRERFELPAFCVRSSCSSRIELPIPAEGDCRWRTFSSGRPQRFQRGALPLSYSSKMACHAYSVFKVLWVSWYKKKRARLPPGPLWLLLSALRREPQRADPKGLAMRGG